MHVRYRDLSVKDPEHKQRLLDAIDQVLTHGRLILGPELITFEEKFAGLCQKQYAVGTNSGTDALVLALRALGIGPGDEVITTPLSWIITANSIVMVGAKPVYVDIQDDFNIDPSKIEAAITEKTKAIVPVHFTGRLCRMEEILTIAERHNLFVIEDAAQAYGAHRNDRFAGSFGSANCFSLNPMKVLPAYGEAGAVTTDSEEVAENVKLLRYAGTVNKEDCHVPALNGKMDTIQAAMLMVELDYVEQRIARRREIAKMYSEALADCLICPPQDDGFEVFYSYIVRTDARGALREHLTKSEIETFIQHPNLLPFHTAYKGQYDPEIPRAKEIVAQILSLPVAETITDEEVEYVVKCIREFFGKA